MIKKIICSFCCILILTTCLCSANYKNSFCIKNEKYIENLDVEKDIDYTHRYKMQSVALLGVIQGVTEFLPISSTGHMILVEDLVDAGKSIKTKHARNPAMESYFAIIQSGSILAILILYRKRVLDMLLACFFKNKKGAHLIKNLLLSFLPAGILGLLFDGILQYLTYKPFCIACALILGALLIFYAESRYTKLSNKVMNIDKLNGAICIKIGLWQCLALFPGMSRSMSTIVGGYLCGLDKKTAAEYSFLLGFVTLSAATSFKFYKDYRVIFQYFDTLTFICGIVIAFIFSVLTIKLFVSFLQKYNLRIFAWYRILLGIIVLLVLK